MSSTITQVGQNSNELFTLLKDSLVVDTTMPNLGDVDLDFAIPDMPADDLTNIGMPDKISLEMLTEGTLNGNGVFDRLMHATGLHIKQEYEKGRITANNYADVYLGSVQSVLAQSVSFVLGKDRSYWEALNARGNALAATYGIVRARADVVTAKYAAAGQKLSAGRLVVDAYTAQAEYATGKMGLASGYQGVLQSEAQTALITEQQDAARAETKETLLAGGPIQGIKAIEKQTAQKNMEVATQQVLVMKENVDTARAQTKNTLNDGGAVAGLLAVDKQIKEAQKLLTAEQADAARAQTKETNAAGATILGIAGSQITLGKFQAKLMEEQYETQYAQTKDRLSNGTTVGGLVSKDILIKTAQAKLVSEQYEAQRGQVRGTLSTGEPVIGVMGAQTKLYEQQTESYKHDAMHKGVKALLDTWTARKSLDDAVTVPANIDTASINTAMATYKSAIGI